MYNFEMLGRELERRGKGEAIKKLAESDSGRALAGMIDGDKIESAARTGDADALKAILSSVLSTAEGRALAENVKKMMEK